MNKLKPRDIAPKTDNLVITCMDLRFHKITRQVLLEDYKVDVEESDRLILAGSSKAVADGTLIPQIEKSHELHGISNVWVVDHADCGGFGGIAAFENDESKEAQAHFESMARAQEAIHKVLPELVVTTFLINLDGEKVISEDS